MNGGDFAPSLKEFLLWMSGLVGLAGTMLGLRARKSKDDTQRAKDTAEAGIYASTLAATIIDKDNGWRVARENEALLRQAAGDVARLTATQDAQQHEIARLQQQVKNLQQFIGRIVDADLAKKLGPDFVDFARSQAGALDDDLTTPLGKSKP